MKTVYLCDDSIDSIFTAIYDAWDSRLGHNNIRIDILTQESDYNFELFSKYIHVVVDKDKVSKVANSIYSKISEQAYEMVCNASCANDEKKGDIIYRFLILGFKIGGKIVDFLNDDVVMNIFDLNRKVDRESHHYLGFLRFVEINKQILIAKIKPRSDIIRNIAPHFQDRLSNENFIIYDEGRKTAIVHRSCNDSIYIVGNELNFDKLLETTENQDNFSLLWKIFYDSIAIKERKNLDLQRSNLPKHYRNNMTEFINPL